MARQGLGAIAIVSFSGLVLDQAHLASAPRGTVEVGELTPVGEAGMTIAALPEVVVVAKRVASRVAQADAAPAMKADAESALLK